MKRFLAFALVLILIIPMLSTAFLSVSAEEKSPSRILEGKTYSILGDSISTYTNVSSGKAADTTNSTIRKSAVHYTPGKWDGVYLEDTWWIQLEEITGLRRLVNNSWSGSAVFAERVGTVGGYVDRCVQLHDDTGENAGEEPDIIFVFLGTNDFSYYQDQLFVEGGIDYDKLIVKTADGYSYAEPTSVVEAYAIMIHKITVRYADAELYCFSMMARRDTNRDKVPQPIEFNAELKAISDRFGAIYVDLFDVGIPTEDGLFDRYFPDLRVHPGVLGMDNVTSAVWTSMLHNSRFIPEGTELCEIKTELVGATSTSPSLISMVKGDSYEARILTREKHTADVKVTMGGVDITSECYSDGRIFIESVTDDVLIEAKETLDTESLLTYQWTALGDGQLVSLSKTENGEYAYNKLTQTGGEIVDGVFSEVKYELETEIVLFHNIEWSVEWQSEGTFKNKSSNGSILLAREESFSSGQPYIFKCEKSIVAIGVIAGSYQNYGIKLSDHGIDAAAKHVYKLQNRVFEDGSNMVYLYVDGVEIGPMNHHYEGTTDTGEISNWLSGQDIVLGCMGSKSHPISNGSIDYLIIRAGGASVSDPEPTPEPAPDPAPDPDPTPDPEPEPDTHEHSFKTTVVAPTCTDGGFTLHVCDCGFACVSEAVSAKGHVFDRQIPDALHIKSEATSESPALYYVSCVCGALGEETFEFGEPFDSNIFSSAAFWIVVAIILVSEAFVFIVIGKLKREVKMK